MEPSNLSKAIPITWFSPLTKKTPKKKPSYNPNKEFHSISTNIMDNWDITIGGLNHKLIQANLRRDAVLTEVIQLRSSMEEMEKQMKKLELYFQDQKYALKQAAVGITIS